MAQKGEYGLYFSTVGGANNATLSTTACTWLGAIVVGSAGGAELTVLDSDGGSTICVITASTVASVVVLPAMPIVCTSGLAATCSGTGGYTVFYGR